MKNRHKNPKKGGVVRRGQKTPYKKGSPEEIEARVDEVEKLYFGQHKRKAEVHEIICKKFRVTWRTVDDDIARARARLIKLLSETKNEMRARALAVYQSVIETGNAREKVLAQERIDKLLGLEAPRIFGHGGTGDLPPIKSEIKDKSPRPFKETSRSDLLAVIALAKSKMKKA